MTLRSIAPAPSDALRPLAVPGDAHRPAVTSAGSPTPRRAGDEARALLVRGAELLLAYGTPADRLERLIARMATHLGERAQVLSTPTSLFLAFGEADDQRVHLLRVEPGDIDLGKLVEFDETFEALEDGHATIAETLARLDALDSAPARFGPATVVPAFGLASAGAATLFGGGLAELFGAGIVGVVASGVVLWTARRADVARIHVLLAAFVSAALAVAASHVIGPLNASIVTLAGLIVLVPGLSLTVATIELAARHLVSGTARLAGALTVFLSLALGVAFGRLAASRWLGPAVEGVSDPVTEGVRWLALGISPVAFAVLFQARWRELPWIQVASLAGVLVASEASAAQGAEAGSFLGALVVGLVANVYARLYDRPASVPLVPGLLMLVPGSIGFRALDLFLAKDAVAGINGAFEAGIVAVALAGGLLVANVIVAPGRTL